MYLGTHACLPVLIVSAIDIIRLSSKKTKFLNNRQLALIGLAGILPDFLWPHFSMQQRLNSWTHTLWFLLLLIPVVLLFARWKIKKDYLKFTLIFWIAASLHVLMDALSGGIKFFYPYGNVIGDYYISHPTWITWDIVFISSTALLLFSSFKIQTIIMKNPRI